MIDLFPLNASLGELIFLGLFTFVMGIFAGMVGVALGAVRLPVMLALGFNPVVAAGTNLGVTILGGSAAAVPHWRDGRVVSRVVLIIGVPAILGSLLGGLLADGVKAWMLLTLIATLTIISSMISFRQWWIEIKPSLSLVPDQNLNNFRTADLKHGIKLNSRNQSAYAGIVLVIGVIGGAAGLVLAVLRIPVLVNVMKMDPRYAAGTNNVIGVFAGVSGFIGHAANLNFDVAVLMVMGISGMVGSFIGARQTGRIGDATMRLIIALLLAGTTPIVVVRIFYEYPN
ncbi:MAG: sulfite exporter TauE/SafE family protein [SAR202 cluster bacterium]|nr:sulfite exporter TauE/SafE family protein [SAR202 cluster bacterium]|tara:strand:- start:84 stop:938 length:855 start_codon:yes stop_codon:yes gene_type:complete